MVCNPIVLCERLYLRQAIAFAFFNIGIGGLQAVAVGADFGPAIIIVTCIDDVSICIGLLQKLPKAIVFIVSGYPRVGIVKLNML